MNGLGILATIKALAAAIAEFFRWMTKREETSPERMAEKEREDHDAIVEKAEKAIDAARPGDVVDLGALMRDKSESAR